METSKVTLNSIMRILTILFLTASLFACGSMEVLDGLCYNDREGTFLCPPELEEIPIQEPIEEPLCNPLESLEEQLESCIMVA